MQIFENFPGEHVPDPPLELFLLLKLLKINSAEKKTTLEKVTKFGALPWKRFWIHPWYKNRPATYFSGKTTYFSGNVTSPYAFLHWEMKKIMASYFIVFISL